MSKRTFLGPLIGKGVGQCELVNAETGSVLASRAEPAFDSKTRKKGLLGRDSIPEDYALIIAPCSAVHTFGMRTPLDLVFVAKNGTIIKTCRGVQPWRMAGSMRAYAVVEAAQGFIERTEIVPGEAVALREIPGARRVAESLPALAVPPAAAGRGSRVRQADTHKRVTLADVISQRTALAWYESVAIVQELCEVVLALGQSRDPRVPELRHIVLTPDGSVELLREGPAEHSPIHRASLVLLALTPEAALPTQLRLLALEEVSPWPKLGDLKDLHRELEFFERPDRREIVRAVYERFRSQPASMDVEPVVPPPLLEPPPPKRHWRWWSSRSVWSGLGIVLLTAAVGAGVWAWPRTEGQWMRSGVSIAARATAVATQVVVEKARAQVEVAKWKLRMNSRPPTPVPPIRAEAVTPTPVTPLPVDPTGQPAALAPQLPGQTPPAGRPQPAVPTPDAAVSQPPAQTAVSPPPADSPGSSVPSSPVGGALQSAAAVYSVSDPLVVPPQLVRPNMPSGPPAGIRIEDMAEVEVVVSSTGEVTSVRLVSTGAGPRPAMMLSAVKAWRFQPATRGGQPVHYRLRLRLPAN